MNITLAAGEIKSRELNAFTTLEKNHKVIEAHAERLWAHVVGTCLHLHSTCTARGRAEEDACGGSWRQEKQKRGWRWEQKTEGTSECTEAGNRQVYRCRTRTSAAGNQGE